MASASEDKKPPPASSSSEALQAFDRLYERGDLEEALALCMRARKRFPESAALTHAHGLALWGLGKFRNAAEVMQQALEQDASLEEARLDLAALLVDHLGYPADALSLLRSPRRWFSDAALRALAYAVRARAWLARDQPGSGVKELRKARRQLPGDAGLAADLAEMQMEAHDTKGARRALNEALELDPRQARAHWLHGLLLDREGEQEAAMEAFSRAVELSPEEYFVPHRFTEEEFDAHVESALRKIPARFRRQLDNVELAVEQYPPEQLLRQENLSPFLLGLFLGTPMTERSFESADLPPRILIFQRNLENVCRTRGELVREIGITVRHEVGHLMGMDEDSIGEAGHA